MPLEDTRRPAGTEGRSDVPPLTGLDARFVNSKATAHPSGGLIVSLILTQDCRPGLSSAVPFGTGQLVLATQDCILGQVQTALRDYLDVGYVMITVTYQACIRN